MVLCYHWYGNLSPAILAPQWLCVVQTTAPRQHERCIFSRPAASMHVETYT